MNQFLSDPLVTQFQWALQATNSPENIEKFQKEIGNISRLRGIQPVYNALRRLELIAKLRKPTLAIYDHSFHFIGGAQKYGLTLIHALKDVCDITIIANKPVSCENFQTWYQIDLKTCQLKIIPLPFFEIQGTPHLDPASVSRDIPNPFHLISLESGNYDIFINNSMNEMVFPLAEVSVLICHFPERRPRSYFYVDRYTRMIYNSQYTAEWIKKKWGLTPHQHFYPPVDMEAYDSTCSKANIILSVARFEVEGSKRQKEMLNTFIKMSQHCPEVKDHWKLVLAGGTPYPDKNSYLLSLQTTLKKSRLSNIEIKVNIPAAELKSLYRQARIFWHLCGLNQNDPANVEHFGMTTVEAMQNHLVPVVFNGGGQVEIVEQGKSGFRVDSTAQLISHTLELIRDSKLMDTLAKNAYAKSQLFTRSRFEERTRTFFSSIIQQLCALPQG